MRERLQAGPGPQAALGQPDGSPGPVPSRWTLPRIRASVPWLAGYSLSGVWQVLRGSGLQVRSGRVQAYSPDPDYQSKLQELLRVLREAAAAPGQIEALFVDEMGYGR